MACLNASLGMATLNCGQPFLRRRPINSKAGFKELMDSLFCHRNPGCLGSWNVVKQIIEQTRDGVQALLPFLSADDRADIEADASWWSEDDYEQFMQPVQEASSVECLLDRLSRSQNLSDDLLVRLLEATKLLAKHKLLDQLS